MIKQIAYKLRTNDYVVWEESSYELVIEDQDNNTYILTLGDNYSFLLSGEAPISCELYFLIEDMLLPLMPILLSPSLNIDVGGNSAPHAPKGEKK